MIESLLYPKDLIMPHDKAVLEQEKYSKFLDLKIEDSMGKLLPLIDRVAGII